MKNRTLLWLARALALCSVFNFGFSPVFAQGSLTPQGAPVPTMKTLAQIEPRTPISSAPFTINQSGSYYLTTNIAVSSGNAITIATNGVTLDLNGFTISSTEASPTGTGILLGSGATDIIIRNGHIQGQVAYNAGVYSGSGFANGIEESAFSPPFNVRVSGVAVSGCLDDGIAVGPNSTVVESCTVRIVGGYGIEADTVVHSTAELCGSDAIRADTVADSFGNCAGGGDGIDASFTVKNSSGFSNTGTGLSTATANNCYGVSLFGDGIDADVASGSEGDNLGGGSGNGISAAATAQNCSGTATGGGIGVDARYSVENCYGISDSGYGISAGSAFNCYGATSGGGIGVNANTAQNCWGTSTGSGTGVNAFNAQNCYGTSSSGVGINAATAAYCTGSGGTAINANIGTGCLAAAGTNNITHKYNMP